MTHPTYPLQHEQRAEIIMAPNTSDAILKIQQQFAKRRDTEFPGWREKYDAEVKEWIAWHSKPNRRA